MQAPRPIKVIKTDHHKKKKLAARLAYGAVRTVTTTVGSMIEGVDDAAEALFDAAEDFMDMAQSTYKSLKAMRKSYQTDPWPKPSDLPDVRDLFEPEDVDNMSKKELKKHEKAKAKAPRPAPLLLNIPKGNDPLLAITLMSAIDTNANRKKAWIETEIHRTKRSSDNYDKMQAMKKEMEDAQYNFGYDIEEYMDGSLSWLPGGMTVEERAAKKAEKEAEAEEEAKVDPHEQKKADKAEETQLV